MTTPKDELSKLPTLVSEAITNLDATRLNSLISMAKQEQPECTTEIKDILEKQMQKWRAEILDEDDKKTLNDIVKVIQVLRNNDFLVDFSVVPASLLSEIMQQIFLLKPSDAEWLLNKMPRYRRGYSVTYADLAIIEKNILDAVESTAAFSFLNTISYVNGLTIDVVSDLYRVIVNDYMQIDSKHAITLALQGYMHITPDGEGYEFKKIPSTEVYESILIYDSPNCLEEFLKQVKDDPTFSPVLDPNRNILSKKIRRRSILSQAIDACAPKSIAVLLDSLQFLPTELEPFIQKAANNSNLVIVLALCRNDLNQAVRYLFNDSLFSNTTEARKQLHDHLITMLRFSPIEVLDKIVDTYDNAQNKAALQDSYRQAKEQFLQYAPAFSRTSLREANKIKTRYGRDVSATLDMEYGKNRSELVTSLVKKIKYSTTENPFKPTKSELLELPTSKSGSRIFAALLENIADYNFASNPNAVNRKQFSTVNQSRHMLTPVSGYAWGKPLISAVSQYSRSTQLTKYPHLKDNVYSLTYHDKAINNMVCIGYFGGMVWEHGRLPLQDTIGDIEDLLEKMRRPLKKNPDPGATTQEIKEYQEELTEFYADAAKLVWLIGNTTPLERGSGSVAELILKAIFELQGLRAPTLKLAFPQLDVLDITFPLDDYMKLFTYFCEPSSLPEHLRKPSLSSLSAGEQIVAYYNEINGVALIPRVPNLSKTLAEVDAAYAPLFSSQDDDNAAAQAHQPKPPPSGAETRRRINAEAEQKVRAAANRAEAEAARTTRQKKAPPPPPKKAPPPPKRPPPPPKR